jgi:DNA-directed RNA polymerase specialized sigma24 family protein
MPHAATATQPDTWQSAAAALYRITAGAARRLCRACNVPPAEHEEVVAEALLDMCASLRRAWGRGVRAVDCTYYARHGLAAACARRNRPLPPLAGDAAARGPGPAEQLEAGELLDDLLRRLPDGRMRQAVQLKAEGLSTAEVAAAMGVCRQRVEHLLLRARALLAR